MPRFTYVVKDSRGQTLSETVESADQESLVDRLQKQGYFVVSVQAEEALPKTKKEAVSKKSKQHTFTHNAVKLEDLLVFSRQLGTMLESGVTLLRSLEVIVSQVESKQLFTVLDQVKKDVEQGSSLSGSLAKHPKVFNQFWVSLVEVGEASGTMPLVLDKLTFYLEQQAAFQATIVSAIVYPAILFFVACGAVGFFAFFVGPKFEEVFKAMNVDLPWITRALLGSFRFIKTKFPLLLGILAVIVVLFKRYSKTTTGRIQIERFLYGLPTFGRVFKLIVIEKFASQMAILVDSGVPILYALDITQPLVDNKTCEMIVADIKEGVRQGELLVSPMIRSEFFPPMAIQMIMVGEETGELSKMLKHVSKFYQTAVETFMKRFGTMIEPFMLVFMGGVIGVIVLAMFLPMFNITQLGGAK